MNEAELKHRTKPFALRIIKLLAELVMDAGLLKKARVEPLWQEAGELTAIMASSRISATRRLQNRKSAIENRK